MPATFRSNCMPAAEVRRASTNGDGVQKLPFKAHAWVEVDGRVVNDKPYMREMYTVLDRC